MGKLTLCRPFRDLCSSRQNTPGFEITGLHESDLINVQHVICSASDGLTVRQFDVHAVLSMDIVSE